ncbi:MAG: cytochrome b5 domain-containing protein [Actinomycetota bacterium]
MKRFAGRAGFLCVVSVAVLLVLAAVGCGGTTTSEKTTPSTTPKTTGTTPSTSPPSTTPSAKAFTATELATFNGQNGQPAYVAVDGVVYDVTDSSFWPSGSHSSCNLGAMAGKDLSQVIKQAPPRMYDNLKRFPVVGTMAQ